MRLRHRRATLAWAPGFLVLAAVLLAPSWALASGPASDTGAAAASTTERSRDAAAGPGAPASRQERVRLWNREAIAAYERNEIGRAYVLFSKAAAADDPSAQYNLAVMRLRGETTGPSVARATGLLRLSAAAGFAPAQFMLASMLDTGWHLARSSEEATRWFTLAAQQGHPDAALALGMQYFLGRGAAQDYAQAARWIMVAAQADDVAAQYLLGSMYEDGTGVRRDLREALVWYVAAARQGDVAARAKASAIAERLAADKDS